jgi:hypothetical protein
MKESVEYEAPQIRDLEELGLAGQFPLGVDDTCSAGTGNAKHSCTSGTGPIQNVDCAPAGAT